VADHMCNIGAYGIPKNSYKFIEHNKLLELSLNENDGRKVEKKMYIP
jgi:hypothetical protein